MFLLGNQHCQKNTWCPTGLSSVVGWDSGPTRKAGQFASESVVKLLRNAWSVSSGMGGQFGAESLVRLVRNTHLERHACWGFWKCRKALRRLGHKWNHKRIYRVYCELRLNQKRRAKRRLPKRFKQPLLTPQGPNQVWSVDFMSDNLYIGSRFRTFNVIDDFNRECLTVEIDTSITTQAYPGL